MRESRTLNFFHRLLHTYGGIQLHSFVSYALPCQTPFCQTAPLLSSVARQQNFTEYCREGSTSTAIAPTSASDVVGQHNKIGVINFRATLVHWKVIKSAEHYLSWIQKRLEITHWSACWKSSTRFHHLKMRSTRIIILFIRIFNYSKLGVQSSSLCWHIYFNSLHSHLQTSVTCHSWSSRFTFAVYTVRELNAFQL